MNPNDNQDDTPFDNRLDAQREIIRASLNEIASNIGMMMRDAGLHFPVYITVRDIGDSLATIATPVDPSDDDWQHASDIVCRIMEDRWRYEIAEPRIALRGCERGPDGRSRGHSRNIRVLPRDPQRVSRRHV